MQVDEVRYQVFVSSTYTDLAAERAKTLQAILQLQAFPAGMELFPSADDDQLEFIKREIDSSDYYILILAGRYGSLADDGLSFTEKEYEYALSSGKPIMAFLHKDIDKLTGDKLERKDSGRTKLNAFRNRAKKGRLVNFYLNEDELQAQVLHSLQYIFRVKPLRGWVRAGMTPREDLEKIASLQQRIFELEADNMKLRQHQIETNDEMGSGLDTAYWFLDLSDFVFGGKWPSIKSYELRMTWNDMLLAVFDSGSSYVVVDKANRNIARLLISLIPEIPDDQWREQANSYLVAVQASFPDSKAISAIRNGIHNQFTGLGLLEETVTTIYDKVPFSSSSVPRTTSIWSLTPNGERHIARLRRRQVTRA